MPHRYDYMSRYALPMSVQFLSFILLFFGSISAFPELKSVVRHLFVKFTSTVQGAIIQKPEEHI